MAIAHLLCRASDGLDAPVVDVEVHQSRGLPAFNLVGLPQTSVKEAKERVRSAIINSGFEFPMARLTVNLAPAELPKQGGRYDLAIALGILIASKQLKAEVVKNIEFSGELALSGQLRRCPGLLPAIVAASKAERRIVIPTQNAFENQLANYDGVTLSESLSQTVIWLNGQCQLPSFTDHVIAPELEQSKYVDLSDVIDQAHAKLALTIAAAGGHNLLMLGPPGTGKTLLANCMPGLLPPLNKSQAIESAIIYSVCDIYRSDAALLTPPFRSPHHGASAVALVGGGSVPKPGEISLAHNGVLFLDELTEFDRKTLDHLREPLESGFVEISRAAGKCRFPANFQLIAALNPSPSGDICKHQTSDQILKYLSKISGPFLDRFDLSISVPKLSAQALAQGYKSQSSESEAARLTIEQAQQKQQQRQGCLNSQLSGRSIEELALFKPEDLRYLQAACEQMGFSVRGYHRLQRVAITIADLQQEDVKKAHITQALSYREMDKLLHRLKQQY